MKPTIKRCAIYTRKSTEEGLEQEFNTLHAQREACVAYITSQKSEGWSLVKTQYDDGGFSGGTMDRPALNQLIDDIKDGKIDVIVVYKIDRLTRALIDFSRLVEIFDQHNVTFVSVTQSFNTTTSMGRLTLNVLLSFAQFEREVIGERIRDKIAASKQKGMWMGGRVPFGYNVDERKLVINDEQAETVKFIYTSYLSLGSVIKLKQYLDDNDIRSREYKGKTGVRGGLCFSRGHLHEMLTNPIYIGKIRHKGIVYDGQHTGIISQHMWDHVQSTLVNKAVNPRETIYDKIDLLLKGKIFDCEGNRYTPSFTTKNGVRYSYYISPLLNQHKDHPNNVIARIPSETFETIVLQATSDLLNGNNIFKLLDIDECDKKLNNWIIANTGKIKPLEIIGEALKKIVISENKLVLQFNWPALNEKIIEDLQIELPMPKQEVYLHTIPFSTRRANKGTLIIQSHTDSPKDDPFARTPLELKNWVRGIVWRDEFFSGTMIADIAKREKIDPRYVGRLIDASLNI